jgi:hypothetical protein
MKKLMMVVSLMVVTSMVSALEISGPGKSSNDNRVKATNDQGQLQNSQSVSTTSNAIDYSQNSSSHGSDLSNAIGTGIAPNLTSGFNTCLGSASFGAGWSGFGFGVGKTYEDRPCNRRNDSMTWRKWVVWQQQEKSCVKMLMFFVLLLELENLVGYKMRIF